MMLAVSVACLMISIVCVVVIALAVRDLPFPPRMPVPVGSATENALGILGFALLGCGLIPFLLSLPTRGQPALPVPDFALPLATLGLVCLMLHILKARRAVQSRPEAERQD